MRRKSVLNNQTLASFVYTKRCGLDYFLPITRGIGTGYFHNDCEPDGAERRCRIHRAYSLTPAG